MSFLLPFQVVHGVSLDSKVEEINQQRDVMKAFHDADTTTYFPSSTWPDDCIESSEVKTNTAETVKMVGYF